MRLLLALLCFFSLTAPLQAAPRARVLVLNSYSADFVWTKNLNSGIEAGFAGAGLPVELSLEFMDTKRIPPSKAYQDLLASLYRFRYQATPFDVILSSDDDALHFLLSHPTLFPHTPVVFCGVNYFDERKRPPYLTGVLEALDLRGTLEAARRLQPNAKQVVTINDRSRTGQDNRKLVQALIPTYKQLSFRFFENLTYQELLREVGRLPHDSIVLLLTFNRDRAGKAISYDQLVQGVGMASTAPVYGVWDFFLGRGIVGGMITRGFDQGALAAQLAARVIRGEAPAQIPIMRQVPSHPMFDYRVMQRFQLSLSALPPGSTVINRPSERYSIPKQWLWSGLALLFLLSLFSTILLLDIDRRRRTERALRESESKFRMLTETAPFAIFIARQGRLLYLNPSLEALSGYSRQELQGMELCTLLPEEKDWLKQTQAAEKELELHRKDGQCRSVILRLQPLLFAGEWATLGTFYDITDRKRAEEEKANARQKEEQIRALREADRLKSEFLSVISHELRTPLNSITGFASLLDDEVGGTLSEPQHQYTSRILEGADRMLGLINDLLDLARMQAGKFDFEFAPLAYPPIIDQAIAFIEPLAQRKNLRIEREVVVPTELCLDGNRIGQVLINLLSNSVKFTPAGGRILVKAWIEDEKCITEVTDSGIGIAAADLPKLFAPFMQLDMGLTRKSGGTGLGLSISKKIVEAHHGTISASSPGPGQGSTFRFILPLKQ